MKNSKIIEAYDKITLDEFSKQKIFSQISEKAYKKSSQKEQKIFNINKVTTLIAACACALIIFANPVVQAKVQEYVSHFASWITGNSKEDYLEEIEKEVQNNGCSLKIINAKREEKNVALRYEVTLPKNIDEIVNMDDYNYKDYENEYNKFRYKNTIYDSEIFKYFEIYVNNCELNYINSDNFLYNEHIIGANIRDVEIKENKIIQELIVYMDDEYKNQDIDFEIRAKRFKIGKELIVANLKLDYTLKGNEYQNEKLIIKPINQKIKINDNNTINFYGYSYTRTGIKLYARDNGYSHNNFRIIKLNVKDNYGSEYLMYPMYTNQSIIDGQIDRIDAIMNEEELDIMVFSIYENSEDFDSKYSNYWNENIKNINIKIFVEDDNEFYKFNKLEKEININFEE